VESYRAESGLLAAQGATLTEQQIAYLTTQKATLQVDLDRARARADSMRRQMASGAGADGISEVLSSQVITDLKAQRAVINRRVAELETKLGAADHAGRNVDVERAAIRRHDSLATFDRWRRQASHRLVLVETDGACPYTDFAFEPSDILLVGRESAGVTGEVVAMADASVLIPQVAGLRSINVAAAAAMVLGEAMRQTGGFAALLAQAGASPPHKTGTSDE
jgi:tRNA(Leu) C34 or U34 (ribose-2'-O)-methylase TrmL